MRLHTCLAALACCFALHAFAQDAPRRAEVRMDEPVASMDVLRGVIYELGRSQNGGSLCIAAGESLATVRPVVEQELQRRGAPALPTPNQVFDAMVARFPCPFSPYRAELRPAQAADLAGSWITREGSLQLLYPPRSPAWRQEQAAPLRCEMVGFFAEGELRTAELRGSRIACPSDATLLAASRRNPRVMAWNVPEPGRMVVTRTDVPQAGEEWQAFVVQAPFSAGGVAFQPGDVLAFQRKALTADPREYAVRFRALRKLD